MRFQSEPVDLVGTYGMRICVFFFGKPLVTLSDLLSLSLLSFEIESFTLTLFDKLF